MKHLATVRWGSAETMPCPHCNTCTRHYFYGADLRWKCKHCGSKFSVTSQTVFASRKMPYRKLLAALHLWACGAAGQPALELRRMLKFKSYNTAFTLVSKLREGLIRGFNTGLISGVVEMDGAHASGRRASEKRGKPQNYRAPEEVQEREKQALLTTAARQKKRREDKAAAVAAGGTLDPGTGQVFPETRRLVFTLRRRSGAKGQGAVVTRVGVGLAESPDVVEALAATYVAIPESVLATDTGTAFSKLGKRFQLHLQVNHSETLSGPEGQHNNNAESFSARQDRSEKGVYLNIEPKYLLDYATETAFREDHRRKAPGAQADLALHQRGRVALLARVHAWAAPRLRDTCHGQSELPGERATQGRAPNVGGCGEVAPIEAQKGPWRARRQRRFERRGPLQCPRNATKGPALTARR